MPARTNEFQKLVKIITRSLTPLGAKVTESAMLYDAEAETHREVDILVESTVLNCNIRLGLECTAVASALDVTRVEAIREKHRKVGINQTIIVSKNGFTSPAKKYAEKNYVKLLTFNAAKSENWSKKFARLQDLHFYARNYFVRSISLIMPTEPSSGFAFGPDTMVRRPEGQWVSLLEFVKQVFEESGVSKAAAAELRENEAKGPDPWLSFRINLGGAVFRDENGVVVNALAMDVVMGYSSNYRALSSRQVEYDGHELVVGGFFDKKTQEHAHVAITESEGLLTASLEVSSSLFPKK